MPRATIVSSTICARSSANGSGSTGTTGSFGLGGALVSLDRQAATTTGAASTKRNIPGTYTVPTVRCITKILLGTDSSVAVRFGRGPPRSLGRARWLYRRHRNRAAAGAHARATGRGEAVGR